MAVLERFTYDSIMHRGARKADGPRHERREVSPHLDSENEGNVPGLTGAEAGGDGPIQSAACTYSVRLFIMAARMRSRGKFDDGRHVDVGSISYMS